MMKKTDVRNCRYWIASNKTDVLRLVNLLRSHAICYEVLSPYPLKEIGKQTTEPSLSPWVFWGGVGGGSLAYALCLWISFTYPLNVAGQPLHHPGYAPVVYILTLLAATSSLFIGFLVLGGLLHYDQNRYDERFGPWIEEGKFVVWAEVDDIQNSFLQSQPELKEGRYA